jgi:Na+/proline symporter
MLVVQEHYAPWVLGLVGAADCLAALVPAAAQILAAASLLSRNLSRFGLPAEKQEQRTAATRLWIVLLSILAFGLLVFARTTLVGLLLLIAYSGITQIFPGLMLSLRKRLPHPWSVAIGIVVGLALLIVFAATGTSIVFGVNFGLVALIANAVVLFGTDAVLSQLRPGPPTQRKVGRYSPDNDQPDLGRFTRPDCEPRVATCFTARPSPCDFGRVIFIVRRPVPVANWTDLAYPGIHSSQP